MAPVFLIRVPKVDAQPKTNYGQERALYAKELADCRRAASWRCRIASWWRGSQKKTACKKADR